METDIVQLNMEFSLIWFLNLQNSCLCCKLADELELTGWFIFLMLKSSCFAVKLPMNLKFLLFYFRNVQNLL